MRGKSALVTGGANGIGRATARALLDLGVNVAVADYDREALENAAKEFRSCPGTAITLQADLANRDELEACFDEAAAELGRLDFLICSAARLGGDYDILEVDPDDWDLTFHINLRSTLILMQKFARHVISAGGGGRIVTLSSSSAFRAQRSRPAYACSKGGLNTLTRIAAAQFGQYNINVNAVAPGITNTPGATTKRGVPFQALQDKVNEGPNANVFKRVSEPEDVASTVVFLCGPGSRQITGQIIQVRAGTIM